MGGRLSAGRALWHQLPRARGLLLAGQGDQSGGLAALQESASIARAQGAVVQLARTLAALSELARQAGDGVLAHEAGVERAAIVGRIGPETHGLVWAAGVFDLPAPPEGTRLNE